MSIPLKLVKFLEILTFFLIWELLGRLRIVADGALPSISEILIKFWEDRNDYPEHVFATIEGTLWYISIFLFARLRNLARTSGNNFDNHVSRMCIAGLLMI